MSDAGEKAISANAEHNGMLLDELDANLTNNAKTNRANIKKTVKIYRVELSMTVVLVVLFVVLQFITGTALKPINIVNVAQVAAPIVLVAFGQLMVMITAGIDLSVGSVFSLTGIVGASVMVKHGVFVGIVAGLLVGAVCGAVNGFLVVKTRLAPFIVTLAMYSAASSLAYVATNGNSISINRTGFALFDQGHLFRIPNFIIYMIVSTVILHFVLRKSLFGRWLYATGSNEEAARLVGVPTNRIKFLAYTLSGTLTAIASLLNASYLMNVEGSAGGGLELVTIAAVVIGGASLFGGIGSAIGALVGTLFETGITNGLNLLGINSFWDGTVTGAVIIVAVLIERGTRMENGTIRKLFGHLAKTPGVIPK
ncbi:ABC transporter permease [Alicyclobacillus tolerans]|uniref:ABC transporter permease n=1 Tax=Alicyclobacillus tolerans TaxID=90970 RepID=UPI001F2A615F|nr:ABC transporter permease [Alicyclobacillus tolerans]MCF8568113.1 ABC transporter permease [Alicyclobacillus tolerans]